LTERHQVLKEKANGLKLRPENFQTILEGVGFVLDQSTGPVGEGGGKIFPQRIQVADHFVNRISKVYRSIQKMPDLIRSIHRW
jgi:hypothetical protein